MNNKNHSKSSKNHTKTSSPKFRPPGEFYGLDTRKIALIDLGQHPSIHGALTRRNAEARSYGRILNDWELNKFKAVLKKVQPGEYFYLNSENHLVSMGVFKNDVEAKRFALVNLFGVQKLMIASGRRLIRAIEALVPPPAVPAPTTVEPAVDEVAVTA